MSTHEDLTRAQEVQPTSERFLGLTFSLVFALIGLYPLIQGGSLRAWSLGLAGLFLVLALLAPNLLRPLNRLWLRLGDGLHRITSPLILGLMFFLVITPIGLMLRLFGKDLLRLRRQPDQSSYWIPRDPPGPPRDSLHRQF